MELHNAEVSVQRSKLLPWMDEALIVPIGDIQFGPDACDVERFKRHIAWAAAQPNAYFIGMGDYVDFGSPSNRATLRALIDKGELYDVVEDVVDNAAQEALEQLQEILAPTKGRWLGLLEGHHFWQFSSGGTSDTKLCEFLDAPFLGTCAFVRVGFARDRKEGHYETPHFTIWAHHGRGSGITQAAPLTKLERIVQAFDADVYLIGHHHKKAAAKMQRIVPVWGRRDTAGHRLSHKNLIIASTGGFLRGYMAGSKRGGIPRGNYVEAGMMTPVALGGVVIYARPRTEGPKRTAASVDLDISI